MVAKDRTKRDIYQALVEIASEKPLDSISVKEICEKAQVSRQTFYNHFIDKYELSTWYLGNELHRIMQGLGTEYGWHEAYSRNFAFVQKNLDTMLRMADTDSINSLTNETIRAAEEDFVASYRKRYGRGPSGLLAFQIHQFSMVTCMVSLDWEKHGCPMPPEEFVDYFLTLVPRELFDALDV